jgi:hypothetical protein
MDLSDESKKGRVRKRGERKRMSRKQNKETIN